MTAATGRHWRTEVISAVDGYVWPTTDLDETAMFEPTREFDVADIEFAKRLDWQIAEARRAEQRRLAEQVVPEQVVPVSWRARVRRWVRDNWTPYRAAYVMATSGTFVGSLVTWLVTR